MRTAVITGVTGQDGSYLTELLLKKGYRVIGTTRDLKSANNKLPCDIASQIELVAADMMNQKSIHDIFATYRPQEVYNLAASTSGAGMFDDPVSNGDINGLAVVRILEAIREVDRGIHFCQASSREIFGEAVDSPQTEKTMPNPRSPYGSAKLYADSMVKVYRQHYGIFACSAILYNHESPRRGMEFVTRKITSAAVKIKLGLANEVCLGNIDALRDWGFAGDYVNGMWLMLQQPYAGDFVFSTGVAHSIRDFCECAFGSLGLDYRDYVKLDPSSFRHTEPVALVGNSEKAKLALGWLPSVHFPELVNMMIASDLKMFDTKNVS